MKKRNPQIIDYILTKVPEYPEQISRRLIEQFGISRQVANGYLKHLVEKEQLVNRGSSRKPHYELTAFTRENIHPEYAKDYTYQMTQGLNEDDIWQQDLKPNFETLPENVQRIWAYAATEMINNAIDHSRGSQMQIHMLRFQKHHHLIIEDNGIGIFKNIQMGKGFQRVKEAVQQLTKGKYTTFPERHSGQGIFFTSRVCTEFTVESGRYGFKRSLKPEQPHDEPETQVYEKESNLIDGTRIHLVVANESPVETQMVFRRFASDFEEMDFTKTVIKLEAARAGEALVARSQAKKLLDGLEKYETVILDFEGVPFIEQGFADEVFRIFRKNNTATALIPINTNTEVSAMIRRAILTP